MTKMKKIIALLCLAALVLCTAGCGNGGENTNTPETAPPAAENQGEAEKTPTVEDDEIEDGGEIDENGELTPPPEQQTTTDVGGADAPVKVEVPAIQLEYDADGNITKQTAIAILQSYPTEQLGIAEGEHQLLFAPDNTEVDSQMCYSIALKDASGATVGVFFVALDGSATYRYDLDNQKYVRL